MVAATTVVIGAGLWEHVRRARAKALAAEPHDAAHSPGRRRTKRALPASTGPTPRAVGRQKNLTGLYVLYFVFWTGLTNTALYVSAVSPGHAMSPRHLAMVWPFLAFLPILAVRLFREARVTLAILLCGVQLMSGSMSVLWFVSRWSGAPDPGRFLRRAPAIIVDNPTRGVLPRIVWHVADDRPLLVAKQQFLLANQDLWLSRMNRGGLYINQGGSGNTGAQQKQIERLLSRIGKVTPLKGGVLGIGHVFAVEAARSEEQGPGSRGIRR